MGLSPLRNRGFNWGQRLLVAGGVLVASLSSTLFISTPVAHAAAGINQQMNFQGRLYTNLGNTVADGYYNIEFNIYQDGAGDTAGNPGGTLKWTEDWLNANSQGVQVKNGFLSVQLGSINDFGTDIDWNQDTIWLSMNIAGTDLVCTPFASCSPDGEMLPMKRMSATAYALNAQNANTLNGLNAGGFIQNKTKASLQTNTSLAIQSAADGNETAYLEGRTNQSAASLLIKQGSAQSGDALRIVNSNDDLIFGINQYGQLNQQNDASFAKLVGIGDGATAGVQLRVTAAASNVGLELIGNGTENIAQFKSVNDTVATIGNNGQTTFQNKADSTNAFNVKKAAPSGASVFNVDTSNGRIGVNNDAPDYAVDVNGDVNIDSNSAYKIDGTDICTSDGCTPASGSSYYIQNTTTPQTANIAIISDVAVPGTEVNPSLLIKQALGQTGDLLRITDNNDVEMGSFDQYGNFQTIGTITGKKGLRGDVNDAAQTAAIIRQLANAATAPVMIIKGGTAPTSTADLLQLQNSNADRVAGFDKDGQLLLGKSNIANGSMKLYNDQGTGSVTIKSGNTTGDITLTLPTALGNSGDCLKASDGSGALGFASCSNGVDTIGTFDGTISYDDGAQISGTTLTFGAASGTKPGIVSTIAQTFAGDKTFVGKIISQNTNNSTNALSVLTESTGTNRSVLNVDTTNERVTVGAPSVSSNAKLDVYANSQTSLRVYQNGTNNVGEFSATSRGVGTVDTNGTTTLSGAGTKFLTTLAVGNTILVNSATPQLRTVTAIASDTSLTVGVAFGGSETGLTFNVGGSAGAGTVDTTASSATVTGTSTTFTTSYKVGDSIAINGEGVHVIKAIASDTSLTLADNATNSVAGMAYSRANFDPLTIKPTGILGVNTLTPQAALHVQSPGVGQVGMAIQAAGGQTANLFNILDSTGTVIANINKDGDFNSRYITSRATVNAVSSVAGESALVATQNAASATAPVFVVKNTGATPTATADLIQLQDGSSNAIAGFNKDGQLYLGRASNNNGSMKFFNNSNANTVTIQSGATTTSYTLTLPLTAGNATDCLQNDGTTAGTLAFGTCGVKTVDTLDHVAKSANGASISGTVLSLQSADNNYAGLVTSGASVQTMGINKTFQNNDTNGDSTTAITVKKTAANGGGTVFNVDTTNSIVDTNGTSRTTSGASQTTATGIFKSGNTSGTQTDGVLIDRNGTGGTTTNGLNITNTDGTLTNGLAFNGTIGTDINRTSGTLTLNGAGGIDLKTNGTTTASLSATGKALFKVTSDAADAFMVQNTGGNQILTVDTSANQVILGKASSVNAKMLFQNSSNSNTITLQSGATTTSYVLTLPLTAGTATDCLQNDGTTAGTLTFATCGVKTVDTLDHVAKSANGASISGTVLSLQSADNAYAGLVTNGASVQTMGIKKTFQNSDTNGDDINALTVKKTAANGGGTVFNVDTTNGRVGVNTGTPGTELDVVGSSRSTSNGTATTGTFNSTNTTGTQTDIVNINRNGSGGTSTNGLNVTSTAGTLTNGVNINNTTGTLTNGLVFSGTIATDINRTSGTLGVNGNTGINFQTGGNGVTGGTTVASLSSNGAALFKNSTDSANALQVQNVAGTRVFNVDATTNTVSIGDSAPYAMRLPGAAGAYASTPDSAATSVTGDFEIVMRMSMTDWTPAGTTEFFTKYNTTGSQVSYRAYISAAGNMHLLWSPNGSTTIDKAASSTVPFTDGQTYWIRMTLDVDNGSGSNEVKFYTAADSTAVPSSWTQLGTTQTTAGVTSVFDSNTTVEIGSRAGGSTNNMSGTVYRAMLINGLGGTTVANFNPAQAGSTASTTFVATTGETWTRNGTATFLSSVSAIFAPTQNQLLVSTLVKTATDAADSFAVQNSSGNQVLAVDTVSNQVVLGKSSTVNGKMVFLNNSGTGTLTIQSGNTTGNITLTLPTTVGSADSCLQNDGTTAGTLAFGTCGVKTVNTFSSSSQTNGATISGTQITFGAADKNGPGMVTAGTQTISGNKTFQNSDGNGDSVTAFGVSKTTANGGASVFNVDTTNSRVGIKNAAPSYELDVTGSGRFTTAVYTPLIDTTSGVPLEIGKTTASSVVLGRSGINTNVAGTASVTGVLSIQDGTATAPGLAFTSQGTLGIYKQATNVLALTTPTGGYIATVVNNVNTAVLSGTGAAVASAGCYNFSSSSDAAGTADTGFCREGVGTVGLRSGTTAQTLNLYNTSNGANYERANLGWSGNSFNVGTQAGGTGTGRNLTFGTNGVNRATFDTSNNLYLGPGVSSGTPGTFTVQATASSAGGTAGGILALQGGNATTGNASGGNLTLMGGTASGTGQAGLVVIGTPTFATVTDSGGGSCAPGATANCQIAAASANNYGVIIIGFQTGTFGLIATLPDPPQGLAAAGRIIYISASGSSADFTLSVNGGGTGNLIAMRANTTATMVWNGNDWTAAGASSSTTLQAAYDNTLQSAGGAELIVSKTAATNGLTIRDSSANPVNGALVSIQSSSAASLLSINSNLTEYASNPGAETAGATSSQFPASTWTALGVNASISRYTTAGDNIASGTASVAVTTVTTATSGVKNSLAAALTANNHYNVSFSARLPLGASAFNDMDVYYSIDGTAASVKCADLQSIKQSINTKINCSFTAPSSSITSSNAIFIRQTGTGSRTWYVDNLSVTVAADYNLIADSGVDDNTNFATNYLSTGTGATVSSRITTDGNTASSSAEVAITTGGTDRGIKSKLSINPISATPTLYRVSVYAKQTVGSAFTDFKVRYTPNNGSNYIDCVDYSTQTVTSNWGKVTCYIKTDATTVSAPQLALVAGSAANRTFRVDDVSFTLASSTTPNVQVGSGLTGGPTTLFTLDKGASAPISGDNESLLGSMYYDTTLGKLQCYEADGWGACGSSPDNIITISPEYTNAVMHGTGVGTMTSDLCANGTGIAINDASTPTPICGTNEARNFYRWTSPQASTQEYSIYVTYQLPTTFKGFTSGTTSLAGRVDSTSNAHINYTIYKVVGGVSPSVTPCNNTPVPVASVTPNAWETKIATGTADPSTCGFTNTSSIMFKISVDAKANANAYIGNLNFTFNNN